MGEDLIENKIYVAELFGSDLQGNDLYKLEPLKQIGNATFVKVPPEFKEGDFVYEDERIMIVKNYPDEFHAIVWHTRSYKPRYNGTYSVDFSAPTFRHASDVEKQILIDAMKKDGKRWNAEKMCIEDIPKRKFKTGDKVRIKDGISSKTNRYIPLSFVEEMDKLIGKTMTIDRYTYEGGYVVCNEYDWRFNEDWLEPWSDEPKKGDLAIFWDGEWKTLAIIKLYGVKHRDCHYDNSGVLWNNAIKFESKEQFEKILNGEI